MSQKRRRLSKSAEFDRVYRKGRSAGNRFFAVYGFARDGTSTGESGSEGQRLGVSVGRKVGNAPQRNEVKRIVREAFWQLSDKLLADHDYVVVARPDSAGLVERERLDGARRELDQLIDQLDGSPASGRQEAA